MELKKLLVWLLVGLGFLFGGSAPAPVNADVAWQKVYKGYVLNQSGQWKTGISELKTLFDASGKKNMQVLYRLTLAEYGMIGYCLATESCTDVSARMDRVESYAKTLMANAEYAGSGKAIMGGLLGMRIGLAPAKGIYLGPQSMSYLDESIKLKPKDPTGWVEMGNAKYHAPAIVGGDKDKAIYHFKKAVELFESQPELKRSNWLYLHALAWMGKAHLEQGRKAEAMAIFKKALTVEPEFSWVKNELLPSVQ